MKFERVSSQIYYFDFYFNVSSPGNLSEAEKDAVSPTDADRKYEGTRGYSERNREP